ncbi:MAG: hypothetical protein Q9209_005434 [Squamulea sp. 1 TL-2023]
MAHGREIRVLCFGASITAGHYNYGFQHHPYATRLKTRLETALPSHHISVEVDGLSGDLIIGGSYLSRLKSHFNVTCGEQFDWLIFQGGGNDLSWDKEPSAIYEAMRELWQISLQRKTKVMALTVTDTEDQRPWTRERYNKLNEMIKSYQQEKFYFADICSRIPFAAMSEEMRKNVWDDGLHFKPPGYDMIGDAVADRLLEVIGAPSTS